MALMICTSHRTGNGKHYQTIQRIKVNMTGSARWRFQNTFDFLLQCRRKRLCNQSCHERQRFFILLLLFFFYQRIVFAPSVNSILSPQSLRGSDRKKGSAKSSFPRRVIKALPSLSQTVCGGKSAPPPTTPPPPPLRVQAPLVTSPRSTEDRIDCSGSSSKSNIPGLVLGERLV